MAIPYNPNLSMGIYRSKPNWYKSQLESKPTVSSTSHEYQVVKRAANECIVQIFQLFVRGIQFLRDTARLVLKETIRSIWTPIVLPKNWKQRERLAINAKLTGCSFIQLVSVPVKIFAALIALLLVIFWERATNWMLDKSEHYTAYFDGCASRLEALKEEGCKPETVDKEDYNEYREWLYNIPSDLCHKK